MKKLIVGLIFLLFAQPAFAQLPKPKPAIAKPTIAQTQANPLLLIQQFSAADLNAAIADANAQTPPDTVAAGCYQAILAVVNSPASNPLPTGVGVFQALQKARDAKALVANLQSPTGPLATINNACAAVVLDAQNTLITLGVSVGLITNPAAGAVALAGLPAAIATFLNLPKL